MLIGFSSDTKKGYDVEVLIDFISGILDNRSVVNIGVIGMGHLGQALTKYFNGRRSKLRIIAAFDNVDPQKAGHEIDHIPCYPMERFEETVEQARHQNRNPRPRRPSLLESVVPIINAGIKGVLNFTSMPLNFPRGIFVENYDIATLLEKVAYFVKRG